MDQKKGKLKLKIIEKADIKTANWSGGTTKELYIYPEDKKYGDRDFTYRISTATVDLEESTFSLLPKYNRYLMILDGEMHINHKGYHHLDMKQFDIDIFHGSWETTSRGRVIDFNLMTSEKCDGTIKYHKNFESLKFKTKDDEHKVLYIYKGKIEGSEIYNEGDVIILESNEYIKLENLEETIVIETTVNLE